MVIYYRFFKNFIPNYLVRWANFIWIFPQDRQIYTIFSRILKKTTLDYPIDRTNLLHIIQ